MTWETITLLFLAGLSAGFIDAIAGGGGLISLPALLWDQLGGGDFSWGGGTRFSS